MRTQEECKTLAGQVASFSKADEVSLSLTDTESSHIRFARNGPTTSGASSSPSLTITSSFGLRAGSITINQFGEADLRDAVKKSEEMARLAPEDPERMPSPGQVAYVPSKAYDATTAERGHEEMARGVSRCIKDAKAAGMVAAGFTECSAGVQCIADSKGLFGYHQFTEASLSETARTADGAGSGWGSSVSHRIGEVDFASVSQQAVAKGLGSVKPRALAPGKYPTILEPSCVANLVSLLTGAMDARRAEEGRSYFSTVKGTRLGEQLFDKRIHITSDPTDPRVPTQPWGSERLPWQATAWIDQGKAATLSTSRYWAKKQGREAVSGPMNTIMAGGSGSLDELIANTKQAVLVTSIWYIRSVDPQSLLFTGLTRDGVFWVEDGKIRYPIHNFRWNESPVAVLKAVEEMSAPVRVSPRGDKSSTYLVPALRTSAFRFSSVSEAV